MELILTLLLAFPVGWFVPRREVAFMAFIAIQQFAFTFQSTELVREWVGGSHAAFPKSPNTIPWSYGVVNLMIYGAGFGLVLLGSRLAARRREQKFGSVHIAA